MASTAVVTVAGTASMTRTAASTHEPELLMGSGWSAAEVFAEGNHGLGLDDIVFLPGVNNGVAPNLACRFTKNVNLKIPLISGPTESVTEEGMAIALAMLGGIGIIHRHMPIQEQAAKVRKVKAAESGFILNPSCLSARHTVADAMKKQEELGCSGIPITENGRMGGRLVGIVTKRDVDGVERTEKLGTIMTREVVLVREPVTLRDACDLMRQSKVAKMPVVNRDNELVALLCRGDLKRSLKHPLASRDANRQLMVSASFSAREPEGWDRAKALKEAGVDILCLDTDDGVDDYVVSFLRQMKESPDFVGIDIIAGRVNSLRQADALCSAGADAIRVGDAFGAEATALFEMSRFLRLNFGVPVIADTGIRDAGQLLKAFALGAACACLDEMLNHCEEAPGDHIYREGVRVKLAPSPNGPRPLELGVAGAVVDKGSAKHLVPFMLEKLRRSLQELGLLAFGDVPKALDNGALRLERQLPPSAANLAEAPKQYPIICGSLHCSR